MCIFFVLFRYNQTGRQECGFALVSLKPDDDRWTNCYSSSFLELSLLHNLVCYFNLWVSFYSKHYFLIYRCSVLSSTIIFIGKNWIKLFWPFRQQHIVFHLPEQYWFLLKSWISTLSLNARNVSWKKNTILFSFGYLTSFGPFI